MKLLVRVSIRPCQLQQVEFIHYFTKIPLKSLNDTGIPENFSAPRYKLHHNHRRISVVYTEISLFHFRLYSKVTMIAQKNQYTCRTKIRYHQCEQYQNQGDRIETGIYNLLLAILSIFEVFYKNYFFAIYRL